MLLGFINTYAACTDLMNRIFRPYLDKFVVVFIGDILIYFRNKEEHTKHLQIVLQTLNKHQLYTTLKKCEFYL